MTSSVVIPLAVLESDLSPASKLGFSYFLYTCGRDQCVSLQGSYRELAETLHIAKTSFMRSVPNWAEKGWITFEKIGKKVILTLVAVPNRDTIALDQDTHPVLPVPTWDTFGPNRDTIVQKSDESDPNRDTFPSNACVESVILPITTTTDLLLINNTLNNNNLTPIIFHPQDQSVPELTADLGLALVSRVLPVPERPKSGAALERWMIKYYQPMEALINRQRPVTGPMAWELIDLVTRYMAWSGSGWMQRIGGLPTLEKVLSTWEMQLSQIGRLRWKPDEITPYPGCPIVGHEEEEPVIRKAQPFATKDELLDYADLLLQYNPELQLVITTPHDGGFVLLAQCGAGDCYVGIDADIWDYPTLGEMELIQAAIDYGQMSQIGQPEPVTI